MNYGHKKKCYMIIVIIIGPQESLNVRRTYIGTKIIRATISTKVMRNVSV